MHALSVRGLAFACVLALSTALSVATHADESVQLAQQTPPAPPPGAQKAPTLPPIPAGMVDLALRKQVRQSSVGHGGVPERAVDGNPNGVYAANSVTHTGDNDPAPWWEVDLGTVSNVKEIRIHNRTDCCAERLAGAVVMTSDKPFPANPLPGAPNDGVLRMQIGPAPLMLLPVNRPVRFVRVQLPRPGVLSLAEVAVIGIPGAPAPGATAGGIPPLPAGSVDLALRKKVRQSSTGYGGVPERAVDGNPNGNYAGNSVSHTADNDKSPWWEVDLGGLFLVHEIRLHNRTDCCMERLGGAVVMTSDRPFAANPLQPLSNDGVMRLRAAPLPFQIIHVRRPVRYVRIQLPQPGYLHLAEVAVIGPQQPGAAPPGAQKK